MIGDRLIEKRSLLTKERLLSMLFICIIFVPPIIYTGCKWNKGIRKEKRTRWRDDLKNIRYLWGHFLVYYAEDNSRMRVPYDDRGEEYALFDLLASFVAACGDNIYDMKNAKSLNTAFCIPSILTEKKVKRKNIDYGLKKINYSEYKYLNKPIDALKEGDIIMIEDPGILKDNTIYFIYFTKIDNWSNPSLGQYTFSSEDEARNILGKNISELSDDSFKTWY